MSKIVFVDICGTLFRSNTTMDFLSMESASFRKKRNSMVYRLLSKALRITVNYDLIRIQGVKAIQGKQRTELDIAIENFYDTFLATRMINETHQIVNELKREGYRIVFISATLDFIAEMVSKKLGADMVYSTSLDYQNGVCMGRINRDLLGRKHHLAEKILSDETTPVEDIAVITDDRTDLELALIAQHVFIVTSEHDVLFWKARLEPGFRIIKK